MIEIVERFKNDAQSPPCAKLYFGHAETVVPLISLLGLFEGPPLTAEGFLLSKHRFIWNFKKILFNFLKGLFAARQSCPTRQTLASWFIANCGVMSMMTCPRCCSRFRSMSIWSIYLVRFFNLIYFLNLIKFKANNTQSILTLLSIISNQRLR